MNERKIAQNIKNARVGQNLSLTHLAQRTGLTRGYLSKIENAHKAPPFSTLLKLAKGLDVDIGSLILENESAAPSGLADFSIDRANERRETGQNTKANDYQYETLAYRKTGKIMEPFIVRPSFDEKEPFSHEGEEFMYVLDGIFEFMYGGQRYILEPGDTIYLNSSVPHCGKSLGEERARVLAVLYSPKRA